MGNFNTDLIKYGNSEMVNSFVDKLVSNFLSYQILLPIGISTTSTLIDNIFCKSTSPSEIISGNIKCSVSDHLSEITIFTDYFANSPKAKSNVFR